MQYNKNADANESGSHVATVTIDLLTTEKRKTTNDEFLNAWRKDVGQLPDVLTIKFTESAIGPAGLAIDLRLQGKTLENLKKASLELQGWLKRYDGTFNITDDLRPGKPELQITLKEGSSTLGIDSKTVADQLRTAFLGTTVNEIQVGAESYEIDVRLASLKQRQHLRSGNLCDHNIRRIINPNLFCCYHTPGKRDTQESIESMAIVQSQYKVISDVNVANANEIVLDTTNRFIPKLLEKYPDVKIAVQGQNKEANTTQGSMVNGFIIGLIGVFLLLSFQFRSYIEPVVVMIVIPFAFIGAVVGHLLLGLDFTMPSMLGFVALAGVVVNDSILLVNFIKNKHTPGTHVSDIAPIASRARFRAIFLTSLTTVLGLLPMLLETSLQAQILVPLVTSLGLRPHGINITGPVRSPSNLLYSG